MIGTVALNANQWNHIVFQWSKNPGTATIYVNGVKEVVGTKTSANTQFHNVVQAIGAREAGGNYFGWMILGSIIEF